MLVATLPKLTLEGDAVSMLVERSPAPALVEPEQQESPKVVNTTRTKTVR